MLGCRLANSCCALLSTACWHTTSSPDLVTCLAPVVLGNVDWNVYRLTHGCAHSIIAYTIVAVPAGCSRVQQGETKLSIGSRLLQQQADVPAGLRAPEQTRQSAGKGHSAARGPRPSPAGGQLAANSE